MKRPGHKNFSAVSHNRSRPEVLFLNLTWRSRGQISSVLLQFLLFAFSNRKFGRHGKWSVTFWQWENNIWDRTWLWDTALKFFGRAFSLRHQITWIQSSNNYGKNARMINHRSMGSCKSRSLVALPSLPPLPSSPRFLHVSFSLPISSGLTGVHTCQPPEYKNLETTPKIFKVIAIFISGPFFCCFLVFTFFDAITVHYLGN